MTASTVVPEVRAGNARGVNESRYADAFRWALLTGVLALGLVAPGAGFAEDLVLAGASEAQKPVLSWETRAGRSYGIPALEVTGFILTLNQFNRRFIDPEVYGPTTPRSGRT